MAYMGYDISRGLQDVLRRNGLEAHIEVDPDGTLYLAAEGRYYQYNRYKITPAQADILSRWLDMGTGSTNEKAYNTIKGILKDADMPANLTIARQAGGMVNMGQWGQRMTPERLGITPRQSHGMLYSNRELSHHVPFGMWGPIAPTFPGERLAPGTMRSFDYRSGGRLLPTTGVYQKAPEAGRMLAQNNDILDDLQLNADIIKPIEAVYPKGKAVPLSEAMPMLASYPNSDAYFSLEKFKEVMATHGIQIGEFTVDGQQMKGIMISNSASRVDKLFYKMTDEEMAALLNPSIDERRGGVSIQKRLDIINGKEGIKRDFNGKVTMEMLESREIIHIPLTETGKAGIEKDFLAYDEHERRQQALADAKEQAKSEYLAEEGRIRRDPNAISGRDIAAVMGNYAWLNSAAHGREVVVGEIRVDDYRTIIGKNIEEMQKAIDKVNGQLTDLAAKSNPKASELTTRQTELRHDMAQLDRDIETMRKSGDLYAGEKIAGMQELQRQYQQELDENQKMLDQWTAAIAPEDKAEAERLEALKERLAKQMELLQKDYDSMAKDGAKDRYAMSAVINGEMASFVISKSDYEKFLRYDDKHRLELFDQLCDKVAIGEVSRDHYQGQGKPYDVFLTADGKELVTREQLEISRSQAVDVEGSALKDLNYKRGFYREGKYGREVSVENVRVEPHPEQEGKYRMTAVIDGKSITHDITQKQYDKFLACDDYHRLKLFSKIFNEVDMKVRPEHKTNIGAAILAGITAGTGLIRDVLWGPYGPGPMMHPHHPMGMHPESVHFAPGPAHAPAVFEERIPGPAPQHTRAADLAAASYEAEAQQQGQGQSTGQGRGMGA